VAAGERPAVEEEVDMRITRKEFVACLLVGLLTGLGMAGCGGSDSDDDGIASAGSSPNASASSSTPAGGSDSDNALKLAQCMRANGVPEWPDPEPGKGISLPDGVGGPRADAAMQKCKQYAPNGGEPPTLDPQQIETQRKLAQCMRAHGVPKFPDPDANGRINIDANKLGMDPQDPRMGAAQQKCQKYSANPSQTPQFGSNG
jgi:hypothetical protein